MEILTAHKTDIGMTKDVNQDGLMIKIAHTQKGKAVFLCVCDGMGGLSQGEKASAHVIYELSAWFDSRFPHIAILEEEEREKAMKEELTKVLKIANEDLGAYGVQNRLRLGTTCTAILIMEDYYYVVHVGDTRLYEILDTVQQITQDQTVLAREIALGRVMPQNAVNDTRESILLQCIGASKMVEPEFQVRKTRRGVVYMLCTDGFRHKIEESELLEGFKPKHMTNERIMEKQCEYFVELNKERMEKDNITVVVAKIN